MNDRALSVEDMGQGSAGSIYTTARLYCIYTADVRLSLVMLNDIIALSLVLYNMCNMHCLKSLLHQKLFYLITECNMGLLSALFVHSVGSNPGISYLGSS